MNIEIGTRRHKLSLVSLVKADNWFYYKIPPLLVVAYAEILLHNLPFVQAVLTLGLILLCIFSVAAYGHIINDIFDIEQDIATGKTNTMAGYTPTKRFGWCVLLILSGSIPLLFIDFGWPAIFLLMLNYVMPTVYSIPWIRLKERGFLGVIADAAGVHAVPTLFVSITFLHVSTPPQWLGYALAISAALWSFLAGLRGIIVHQIADRHRDWQTRVFTFGNCHRRRQLRSLVLRYFVPVEVTTLTVFLLIILPFAPILCVATVLFAIGEWGKIKCQWRLPMFYQEHPTWESYIPLLNNEFYEVWLPCALAAQLILADLRYGLLFVLHLVIFRSIITQRLRILGMLWTDFRTRFISAATSDER